jgi:5'-nucleotidase/UDP-sugar diphosphatase
MKPRFILLAMVALGLGFFTFKVVRHSSRGFVIGVSHIEEIDVSQAGALGLQTISFVHFNDFHAHYQPKSYDGRMLSPLSLLRGYCDQVRAENPSTVFCSAGDEMEKGSIVDLISEGASTIEIYKELGLDLRAVGNHDFAYGLETLRRFVKEPGGVVLCANQSVGQAFHQFELDGVRIGVFSMVGQPWDERDEQYEGPYFKGLDCRYDYVALARKIIETHRDKVDLLFLLSHLGLETDKQVAAEAPGLDFIIGGHSHTLLTRPELSPQGTVIVQAGCYGEQVGRLDVMVDRRSRRMAGYHYGVTRVDPGNMMPNMQLEQKIREICGRYDAKPEEPITTLAAPLSKTKVAQLAGEAAMTVLKADAAVIDVETVWGELAAGPLTRQDVLDAFRVEIEPAGTHGFSSIMTASVRMEEWQAMQRHADPRFVFVGQIETQVQREIRVAIQRRTALRIRNFFSHPAALSSLRFEMEIWEALAKHLASQQVPSKP